MRFPFHLHFSLGASRRFPVRRVGVIALALLLFGAVVALRLQGTNPGDAVLVLFIVPIAICAIEFGTVGGLVAASLGLALVGAGDVFLGGEYTALGYLSRGVAFFVLGGLLGRFVDARRALERQVTRAEEISLDLLATADFDGYFQRLNPAWERTLGYSEAELRARPFLDFVHPDDRERTQAEAAKLADVGTDSVSFRNRYRASDGSYRWLEWNARAVADEGLIYAAARDITERERAEEAVRAAQAEAERANHAKSEFLSRMSHELRTPLNSILGFGQLLEMDGLPGEQREMVGQIVKGGRHLLELINEVLDISRIDAGQFTISPEPVPFEAALNESLAMIRPLADERDISLHSDLVDCGCHVRADQQRLKQVLLNLLSNAIKYNREGGSVHVNCARAGDRLRVAVADTGRGIPSERLKDVFSPFDRLDAEQTQIEGTGLGLALSRRLMTLMDGDLSVESELGVGTTFFIDLALTDAPAAVSQRAEPAQTETGAAPDRPVVALYIEDNVANLRLIEQLLERRERIEVVAAMQGGLGIELARQHRPDVILLDLHLPDMNGDEVLRRLRSDPRTARIPVLVLSADASPGQARRLVDAGARDYLTKPLDVRAFLRAIDEVLQIGEPA